MHSVTERVVSVSELQSIVYELEQHIDEALRSQDMQSVVALLQGMKMRISALHTHTTVPKEIDESLQNEYEGMKNIRDGIVSDMSSLQTQEDAIRETIAQFRSLEKEEEVALRDSERMLHDLLREKQEVTSNLHTLTFEEEKLALIKNAFEMELSEGGALIGREVLDYARTIQESDMQRTQQDDMRRKIERIKIKLEDAGSANGADIMKEYTDTTERDMFLSKEINDLGSSIESLRLLIAELKETLDTEFKTGVGKINTQFQEFFSLMFGGGSAFLSIVMEHKKQKKGDMSVSDEDLEETIDEEESNELGFERGIEINVTLPQKKVKDLHMLSGGERSLTSIALLFAISQVNPPPFLVLDETDAALDEANSRKYGNMLENLSKYSQLIVVTHNRETMSRAQVLYGVTMDATGSSKLLSIHLEDASTYAK